jgi:cyclic-di-GMP-binding biofilm dispersal mediator protein
VKDRELFDASSELIGGAGTGGARGQLTSDGCAGTGGDRSEPRPRDPVAGRRRESGNDGHDKIGDILCEIWALDGNAIPERAIRDGLPLCEAAQTLAARTGAAAVRVDSSDTSAVGALIDGLDRLDILVINAGTGVFGDARELDPEAINRMIDINMRGPYHAAVAAARKMKEGGRIIVIGSVNGDRMPFAGGAAYAMTKSAVQGMVRGLARDFGSLGITVNNVQPGPVNTDMNPADGPLKDLMHSFMAIKRHVEPTKSPASSPIWPGRRPR